jgi:hypothetical protein
VGLKLLDFDSESLQDIQKEIKILQDCKSDHIVSLKGVFSKAKTIWIAMEFCAAGSLSDMMNICRRTLTEPQIAAVMKMSLQGLQYLHSRNIIHRYHLTSPIIITIITITTIITIITIITITIITTTISITITTFTIVGM